ncbi:hypothetical protein [Paucisalibacillus globulus]|uniref:hypothetical protein n=1 Tax=Paucisalibacillus globulus TaxID=351095 RepID=UPI00041D0ADF|nr:hypothetical protein [Paucisalibacillus globulus]
MKVSIKRGLISVVAIISIFILIMTWCYPYSNFSIYKSYAYTPDPMMVDGYIKDLDEFKALFEEELEQNYSKDGIMDYTIDRTQYVLPLFEQDWIVSKDTVKFDMDDLDIILFETRNVRQTLLDLIVREDYTSEQRQYLVDSIGSLLILEESIIEIQTGKAKSRSTLNRQLHNLHGDFMTNFILYEIFYDLARNNS